MKNKKMEELEKEWRYFKNNVPVMEQNPLEYEAAGDEFMRQGYTDEGITNPFEGENAIPDSSFVRGRKVA